MTGGGHYRVLRLFACYVPKVGRRLLSHQHTDQQTQSTACWIGVNGKLGHLTMTDNGATITCPLDPRTNLPTLGVEGGRHASSTQRVELASPQRTTRIFLPPRRSFFAGISVSAILIFKQRSTSSVQAPSVGRDYNPKCSSCQYGKAHRRPTPTETSQPVLEKEGALKKEDFFPGQRVSIDHFVCPGQRFSADHFVCSTKGRLYESRGWTTSCILAA
jgi:hypothetical protein